MPRSLALAALIAAVLLAGPSTAQEERPGWTVIDTDMAFDALVEATQAAVQEAPINIISQASASDGARMQDIEIPGNRVIGIFRNDYARRMLEASVAAGIEAPIRLYVTETPEGARLSWKEPSAVFAPYMDEGGEGLAQLAADLDAIFHDIAQMATQ